MKRILSALLFFFAISQPASAYFVNMEIKSDLGGNYSLAVLVHDQRSYVLKGEFPANVMGAYLRGLFRARTNMTTYSQEPLADEMAEGLRRSFAKDNWLAVAAIMTSPKDHKDDLISLIKTAKLKRNIVVTVNELWAETAQRTSITYGFTISVFDEKGQELARAEEQGIHETREWGYYGAAEILRLVMLTTLRKPEFISALKV